MSYDAEPRVIGESPELEQIRKSVKQIAGESRGETLELLSLLRFLESLHREISEGLFQDSLPNNRQALYALLKDIEANGGWPYICRMRIQAFLKNLEGDTTHSTIAEGTAPDAGSSK
ncbi:MAG: hypothetical protein KME43_06845 [Myxacorys chilensis ATA2-1-KO14]|jgi:hypothetical protein|nr:hypothetical protein [Myxacorys chilensis ATA2-1-KO14]